MEIKGIIKSISPTQRVSDKFTKRELVLTADHATPYSYPVLIEVHQDKCAALDTFRVGDEVTAHCNLKGREWNGPNGVKVFNTITLWKLTK